MVALAMTASASAQDLVERSTPDVGVETEAEVGQPLMQLERVYQSAAVRLAEPVTSGKIGMGRLVLPAGVYTFVKSTGKGRLFQSQAPVTMKNLIGSDRWENAGILLPADGGPPKAYFDTPLILYTVDAPGAKVADAGIADLGTDGFKVELLYGGVSKGTVTLAYREFMRDLARPAFSQELKYDLADGDEIGFRGARLKVIKATNVSIRYVVMKTLGKPAAQ
ncbi:MAG: hypothetical protein U1A07_22425 [Phenylobacterium sp.]|nr:hypothetical protein [Phenylobacterium sp.]